MRAKQTARNIESRAAIQNTLKELVKIGFFSNPVKKIHFLPIQTHGIGYMDRLAIAILEDNTKIVLIAHGPQAGRRKWMNHPDPVLRERSWSCSEVDIQLDSPPPSFSGKGPWNFLMLHRVLTKPVIQWGQRHDQREFLIFFWGDEKLSKVQFAKVKQIL